MDFCHLQSYHDHDTIESGMWCLHCKNKHPQKYICKMCGSELFETNELLSRMEGKIIWSHKNDNKCDDPVPVYPRG
jgi:hypothetical protein